MSFLDRVIGGSLGSFAESVGNVIDKFHLSGEEKQAFKLEMERLQMAATSELEQTMRAELEAKERILTAELQQGDTYTKRARPTVVYIGLAAIVFNYCVAPIVQWVVLNVSPEYVSPLPNLDLPTEFWWAFGSVVSVWSVGRTMERRGAANNLLSLVTGSEKKK